MFIIGLDNRISYWSAGAERIFGWSAEEAVGQPGTSFSLGDWQAIRKQRKSRPPRATGSRVIAAGMCAKMAHAFGGRVMRGWWMRTGPSAPSQKSRATPPMARSRERNENIPSSSNVSGKTHGRLNRREPKVAEGIRTTDETRTGNWRSASVKNGGSARICTTVSVRSWPPRLFFCVQPPENLAPNVERIRRADRSGADCQRERWPGPGSRSRFAPGRIERLRSKERAFRTRLSHQSGRVLPISLSPHGPGAGRDISPKSLPHRAGSRGQCGAARKAKENHDFADPRSPRHHPHVRDIGKGMADTAGHGRMGIHIMKYRANAIGGSLTVDSKPNEGTTMTCMFPDEIISAQGAEESQIQSWRRPRYKVAGLIWVEAYFIVPVKKESKTKTRVQSKRRGILLVDDHPLFRKGTIQLLGQEADIEVRAEADSTRAALEAIRREKFDLAIVDVGLGGGANGIELTKMIKAEQPELPVWSSRCTMKRSMPSVHCGRARAAT